jgi:hypothetical protein
MKAVRAMKAMGAMNLPPGPGLNRRKIRSRSENGD